MREESHELGALISKLRLGDHEISFETYIHMEGEEITELELSIDELVDVALGINYAHKARGGYLVHFKNDVRHNIGRI
jgi:hypothetical protein